MITNYDIRRFLGMPQIDKLYPVTCVDALGVNDDILMFSNKFLMEVDIIDRSTQCTILVDKDFEYLSENNDLIRVSNPKYTFCKIVEAFGFRSKLQLEFDYRMYNDTRFYCRECVIGDNCQIDDGAIIGGTDFSPVMGDTREELIQFPQMGGVFLGDNVVVKYNTMIGKGTFGYTHIGHNTMIDYGCQIGHNCIVGNSCIIAAGTIIGGSTVIGDNCTIGIGAKIRNGLHIGDNVSIGMGSVVIKDIPDNCVVVGNPARIINHKQIFDEGGLV